VKYSEYTLKTLREEIEEAQHIRTCCMDYDSEIHGAPWEENSEDGRYIVNVPYCVANVDIYIEKLKKELSKYLEEVLVPRGTQL